MDTQRACEIMRKVTHLRTQVELSLSFQQRKPWALQFHRKLEDVLTDLKHLTIQAPLAVQTNLKPHGNDSEPADNSIVS